jgi:hypothetical protein
LSAIEKEEEAPPAPAEEEMPAPEEEEEEIELPMLVRKPTAAEVFSPVHLELRTMPVLIFISYSSR